MLSRIAFARLSSASWIRGNASLLSTHIVKTNTTRVQIISPRPGETRKLPLLATRGIAVGSTGITGSRQEERDQTEDERVEGDRLGQREAQPADGLKLVLHLRLAGHRLDLLAEDDADADARADRA